MTRAPAGFRKQQMIAVIASLLSDLPQENDLQDFLISFLTPGEVQTLHRRIQVAQELLRGKSIQEIRDDLRVGYSSVRPIDILLSRLLPGYRASIPDLLEHPESSRKRGLQRLRERSPLLALLAGRAMER